LFSIGDVSSPKQLIHPLKIFLYPLPGLLFDGVEFHPNVVGIHIAILLQDQGSQFNPVGWC
jgi:hypothetical protein